MEQLTLVLVAPGTNLSPFCAAPQHPTPSAGGRRAKGSRNVGHEEATNYPCFPPSYGSTPMAANSR